MVRQVAAGDVGTITDPGHLVAQIVPLRKPRLAELRDAGLVKEASSALSELPVPTARVGVITYDIRLTEASRAHGLAVLAPS